MEGRVNERGKGKLVDKAPERFLGRAQMKNNAQKRGAFAGFAERFRAVFSDNEFANRAQTVGAYSAAFLAAFLVALVSASTFTPVDNSEAADTINATLNGAGYNITISTRGTSSEGDVQNGTVALNITPTADGAMAVGKDTVNVVTNSKSYKIYVSMASGNTNSRLNKDGSASAGAYFSPVAGTAATPIALTNNTWGWALAGNSISGYAFDSTYAMSNGVASDGTSGHSLNTEQKFAAMPASGSEALIATGTVATDSSGENYDIYYGAKATTALASGAYSGTVVYTAIGEASSAAKGEAAIAPEIQTTLDDDTESTQGAGQEVVITTSMYVSSGLALGNISATIGGKECTNASATVGSTGTVSITCNAPRNLTWGDYDVVATFSKFDKSYNIAKGYSIYAPYSVIRDAAAGTYTMQSFTSRTCSEMGTPKAYATQDGSGSVLNGNIINTDVPEVTLKDARNTSHEYRVRKLADGNCWMVDNLRLALSTSTPLTSETSDINYDMDTGRGVDGSTTTPRTISNDLQGTVDPLGTYSTNSSTGIISWTPFVNSQTTDGITWGSPYIDASGTKATTSGTSVSAGVKHFGLDGITVVTESTSYFVNYASRYEEYSRSYDSGNMARTDGDGNTQYDGAYYTWYAATAGSGTYAMTVTAAKNSVCPKNWMLPKGYGEKSWYNLVATIYGMTTTGSTMTDATLASDIAIENNTAKKAPFSIFQAGYYDLKTGQAVAQGANVYYWTSYTASEYAAYVMNFYMSRDFLPQRLEAKFNGSGVRCVVR